MKKPKRMITRFWHLANLTPKPLLVFARYRKGLSPVVSPVASALVAAGTWFGSHRETAEIGTFGVCRVGERLEVEIGKAEWRT